MSVVKSRKSAEEAAAQTRSSVEDQFRFANGAAPALDAVLRRTLALNRVA